MYSSQEQFSAGGGSGTGRWDYRSFYLHIVDFIEKGMSPVEREELLLWWTMYVAVLRTMHNADRHHRQVFGDQSDEFDDDEDDDFDVEDGDTEQLTGFALMRYQAQQTRATASNEAFTDRTNTHAVA